MSNQRNTNTDRAMHKLIQHHPLQRLSSPSRTTSLSIHLLGLASFSYNFHFLSANPNHINQSYGWHFQYLTIIGLALSTATFVFGLASDVTLSPILFTTKNFLSMISAPLAVLISTLYWGLRAIDPTLVVPAELELPLPPDLGFHAAPAIFLVIDLLFLSPPWTITVLPAIGLSAFIAFAYWFWIELCYAKNGFYPYPLFEILGPQERIMLFGGSAVVMAGVTVVLKWVYTRLNGRSMVGGSRPGVGAVRGGQRRQA